MTNAERIARDLGFLVGQYERGEIKAAELFNKAGRLTFQTCDTCIYGQGGQFNLSCKNNDTISCDEGLRRWLAAEVDT